MAGIMVLNIPNGNHLFGAIVSVFSPHLEYWPVVIGYGLIDHIKLIGV
jgi:hypothetical protein